MRTGGEARFAVEAAQLIATVALTLLVVYLTLSGRLSIGTLGFLGYTSLIFGIAAWHTKSGWRIWSYWGVLLGCLAVHAVVVVALRTYLEHQATFVLGVLGTFECGGIYLLLARVAG